MSSAAIQTSGPAIANRQYQQSPHTREQYYPSQPSNAAHSPSSSRKPSRRPSGNGGTSTNVTPTTPQQHNFSAGPDTPSMSTPRGLPLPPSTHASPATQTSTSMLPVAGPSVPPRTSSHQKGSASSSGDYDAQMKNLSLDDRPASSRKVPEEGSDRKKTQVSPHGGSSSRTKHSPGHSRSATAVGSTPVGTTLPREESTVISRLVASDPQEDIAREQARLAEAQPQPVGADVTPVTGLGLVGNEGVDDGGRGAGRSRQDHSRSDRTRKETRFGDYILGQTLGEGEFGKVKMGWKRDGGVQVAIKLIRRETLGSNPSRLPKIYREISILRGLQHPNIVRLHEMVETERHIGIILEYASGGELFDYILNHRYLKDNAARRLFAQLVSGVGYLHKKGIVHRDLKLENLLLDRNRNIIITDFGFANTFNPDDELPEEYIYRLNDKDFVKKSGMEQIGADGHRRGDLMQTSCGSPCYAAPELVVSDSLYTGCKVDVWSCGVILYAMLAGYLPFDDDPANPEGDNINLLYKYIVSTPLTFPEYVTPHARDLLKRILVPDPRKRADLFEVARHSWLSEYAHVVGFITSSTSTTNDIANTTVPSQDHYETPMLARSASVREPSKPHTAVSPVGGLQQKTGNLEQAEVERQRGQRDAKRRTVQVEYVAPQSQTQRGEVQPASTSSNVPVSTSQGTPRTHARTDSQGPTEVAAAGNGYQSTTRTTSERLATASMPPPGKPQREAPRAVSDSTAFGISSPSSTVPATRPSTGGTLSGSRLPSRGNSYGQPAAATVAQTHAQGHVSRPHGKHYVISAPIPQQESANQDYSIGRPSIGRAPSSHQSQSQQQYVPPRSGHKRSSTLGGISERLFGRSSSHHSRPSQDQSVQKPDRRYPPVSMQHPIPNDNYEPRKSTESRRSFGFSRKVSEPPPSKPDRSSRRFSFVPSFKGLGGGHKEPAPPSTAHSIESTQARAQSASRPGMAFGRGQSRSPSQSTTGSNMHVLYDGSLDSRQQDSPVHYNARNNIPTSAPAAQTNFPSNIRRDISGQTLQYPTQATQRGSYYHTNDSEASQPVLPLNKIDSSKPSYPPGFSGYEQDPNMGRKGVLQKNRKFADEYDQRPGHSGSSGSARRVMDMFRRIGKQRGKEDR